MFFFPFLLLAKTFFCPSGSDRRTGCFSFSPHWLVCVESPAERCQDCLTLTLDDPGSIYPTAGDVLRLRCTSHSLKMMCGVFRRQEDQTKMSAKRPESIRQALVWIEYLMCTRMFLSILRRYFWCFHSSLRGTCTVINCNLCSPLMFYCVLFVLGFLCLVKDWTLVRINPPPPQNGIWDGMTFPWGCTELE